MHKQNIDRVVAALFERRGAGLISGGGGVTRQRWGGENSPLLCEHPVTHLTAALESHLESVMILSGCIIFIGLIDFWGFGLVFFNIFQFFFDDVISFVYSIIIIIMCCLRCIYCGIKILGRYLKIVNFSSFYIFIIQR